MRGLECVMDTNKIVPTDSTENVYTVNNSNSTVNISRDDPESSSSRKGHSILWTLAIDLPLLGLVIITAALFALDLLFHNKRGFYCNDPILQHKYTGDTVSVSLLSTVVFAFDLPIILVTEFIFVKAHYNLARLIQALKNTFWLHRSYMYSICFNVIAFEVMKCITGMPRPNFFDVCQPDTAKTCNGSEFVTNFTCTSDFSKVTQSDSYLSFPSGHTSMSVHFAVFVCWYLHRRAFDWRHRTTFLVPVLQMACLSFAIVSSLTRITDNRHHWWDVLFGCILGLLCALYNVFALCNNFVTKSHEEEKPSATSIPLYMDRSRHF